MNISWPPGPQQQTRSSMWLPNRTDGRRMPNGCTYPTCTLHSANYDVSTKKAVWVPYCDELQGHREFPFWMLKISPCCTQIPATKDASNTSNIWFVWGVIGLHYLYTDTYTHCGTRNHVCEMRAWIAQRNRKFWGYDSACSNLPMVNVLNLTQYGATAMWPLATGLVQQLVMHNEKQLCCFVVSVLWERTNNCHIDHSLRTQCCKLVQCLNTEWTLWAMASWAELKKTYGDRLVVPQIRIVLCCCSMLSQFTEVCHRSEN